MSAAEIAIKLSKEPSLVTWEDVVKAFPETIGPWPDDGTSSPESAGFLDYC